MIRTSPATYCRAAGAVLAAAVLSLSTHRADAQQTVDLLAGTLSTPATLSGTSGVLALGSVSSSNFGPSYSGSVSVPLGAISTVSEGFAPLGSSNSFSLSVSGVSAASSTSAMKTFTGVSLIPGATYNLTLTRSAAFTAEVIHSFSVQINEGTTNLLNASAGVGALGAAGVLGLFGANNTATVQFTVPSGTTGDLSASFNSSTIAAGFAGTDTFTGATLTQVPEPRTGVAMLIGAAGLALLRFRSRLRLA